MRWLRRPGSGSRPVLLQAQPEAAVVVEGDDGLGQVEAPDRVALVAHWAPGSTVGRSTSRLVRLLLDHGYTTALISTAEGSEPLAWFGGRPDTVTVLRRPNLGYDFGSWATALNRYPRIETSPRVLLLNDSLAGPFGPIDHLLAQFDQSAADVWGMTDTSQFRRHLQSYCLGFLGGVLSEGPLRRFWRDIRVEQSRDDVIWRYELGLGRLLDEERFVMEAAIPWRRVVGEGKNPTILGWRGLLDAGFPFVKRQLLRDPALAPDGRAVRDELRQRFGVDPDEWI